MSFTDYGIDKNGSISLAGRPLDLLKKDAKKRIVGDRKRRLEEQQKKLKEAEKTRQIKEEEALREKNEFEEKQRVEDEKRKQRGEDFQKNMEEGFIQQETAVVDDQGNRWVKCEYCGKIAKDNEFFSYGGKGHLNLGTCKKCSKTNPETTRKIEDELRRIAEKEKSNKKERDLMICPECGGKLCEKNGRFGKFLGCSNYPDCRFTRR